MTNIYLTDAVSKLETKWRRNI